MTQDNAKQNAEPRGRETAPCKCLNGRRSMAQTCMGMMGKRPSGLLLMLPGVLLIALGPLIVIKPQILVWLLAVGSVLLGTMLLLMAGFMRRMGAQPRG